MLGTMQCKTTLTQAPHCELGYTDTHCPSLHAVYCTMCVVYIMTYHLLLWHTHTRTHAHTHAHTHTHTLNWYRNCHLRTYKKSCIRDLSLKEHIMYNTYIAGVYLGGVGGGIFPPLSYSRPPLEFLDAPTRPAATNSPPLFDILQVRPPLAKILYTALYSYSLSHTVHKLWYIIESVDSLSRDERGFPLMQYITNGGISRAKYTITHFKHHHRVLRLISNRISV